MTALHCSIYLRALVIYIDRAPCDRRPEVLLQHQGPFVPQRGVYHIVFNEATSSQLPARPCEMVSKIHTILSLEIA